MKGFFISVEGIEGTGKTTQAKLLADHIGQKGFDVVRTAEPGGTEISKKIRDLLLSIDSRGMTPVTELFLYNASRAQHIKEVVMPALQMGSAVITDRFSDSTVAYQGYGRGIDLGLIDTLDGISTDGLRPDITLLLDVDVETGLRRNRRINKDDRLELEDISFHKRVREGFLTIAGKEPQRVKLIDCSGGIEEVHQNIINIIDVFLNKNRM
jgi:dTMP kinase